jgi:predicted ATP-dependent serine protease
LRDRKAHSDELFGPLWRVGEVALLFGPRGVGKSILAVQIAESIARGRPVLPIPKGKSRRRGEKVLYVDMQRSEAQWAERYTLAKPVPGKPPRRYRFSSDLLRAGIDLHLADPDAYRKDPHTYAQAAVGREIDDANARIVIVDDILLGGANAARASDLVRTMQTMRYWAMCYEISILIVASAKQRRRPGRSLSRTSPAAARSPTSPTASSPSLPAPSAPNTATSNNSPQ